MPRFLYPVLHQTNRPNPADHRAPLRAVRRGNRRALRVTSAHSPFPAPNGWRRWTKAELRACKMGFRAPYLLAAARRVAEGSTGPGAPADLPVGGSAHRPDGSARRRAEDRRLRAAVCLWISVGVSDRRLGGERLADSLLPEASGDDQNACGIFPKPISARTRAMRSNTCFITCERFSAAIRIPHDRACFLNRLVPIISLANVSGSLIHARRFCGIAATRPERHRLRRVRCPSRHQLDGNRPSSRGRSAHPGRRNPGGHLPSAQRSPGLLLAGERNGLLIDSAQTGGAPFDFGNSPREFTPERVAGRTIAITTTNGTRALRACRGARRCWSEPF